MKKERPSRSGFFNPRILFGFVLCSVFLALIGFGMYWGTSAFAQKPRQNQNALGRPDVVRMIGPVAMNQDLRNLPYVAPKQKEEEERRLTRYPFPLAGSDAPA